MKHCLSIAIALLLQCLAIAAECPDIPLPSVPAGATLVCHTGYAAAVDIDKLVPRWVAYDLTGPHTLGCVKRGDNFHPDEALPPDHRARPADYAKSGYDIGHQAPAQDFAWEEDEMSDSFSLANMAPQLPGLNRAEWERIEETVRAWAWQRGDLVIYVGPVIGAGDATIGDDRVDVPTAFWKVLVDPALGEAIGFEMPQQAISKGDLTPWVKSIADIDAAVGISIPLPAGIDASSAGVLWPADLPGWRRTHQAACN
jgi:endonuclease G